MREQETWSRLLLSLLDESRLLSSDSDKIRSTKLMSSSEVSRSTNLSVLFCTDRKCSITLCSHEKPQKRRETLTCGFLSSLDGSLGHVLAKCVGCGCKPKENPGPMMGQVWIKLHFYKLLCLIISHQNQIIIEERLDTYIYIYINFQTKQLVTAFWNKMTYL